MYNIDRGFEIDVSRGDLVLYFKNQVTKLWLKGNIKKSIWKIVCMDNDIVTLKDCNNQVFRTNLDNVMSLSYLKSVVPLTNSNISKGSYEKYIMTEDIFEKLKQKRNNNFLDHMYDAGTYSLKEHEPKRKLMNSSKIVDTNVEAAKVAAKITTGKVLNKVVMAKVRPQLPMLARGYADHALANVVIANIANFAITNFASDNEKAQYAVDAMMQAAMVDFMAMFNIEEIISEVLTSANVEIPDDKKE